MSVYADIEKQPLELDPKTLGTPEWCEEREREWRIEEQTMRLQYYERLGNKPKTDQIEQDEALLERAARKYQFQREDALDAARVPWMDTPQWREERKREWQAEVQMMRSQYVARHPIECAIRGLMRRLFGSGNTGTK